MPTRLAAINRHPIKGLGEEAIEAVTVTAGRPMPWDRVWALTHGRSAFDPASPEWVEPRNHVIQALNPKLAQLQCAFDEATQVMTLAHPDLGEIAFRPETDEARLANWIAPIAVPATPPPLRLARLPQGDAFTDFPDTHFSIGNLASLRALEEMTGRNLAQIRFRMNLWIDGAAPWEEFDWEGREIAIGAVRFAVTGRVKRCNATNAEPKTGRLDGEIPKRLYERFDHMDFGVYAQARTSGALKTGDEVAP